MKLTLDVSFAEVFTLAVHPKGRSCAYSRVVTCACGMLVLLVAVAPAGPWGL